LSDSLLQYSSAPSFQAPYDYGNQLQEQEPRLSTIASNALNDLAFKLENGLLKLVESLEQKQTTGDWIDSLIIKESNVAYG
jgi:hypothetical protein